MLTILSEDPWRDIPRAGAIGLLRMAPVAQAPNIPDTEIHWARDHLGMVLLTLTIPTRDRVAGGKLPEMSGIRVEEMHLDQTRALVCLRLVQQDHRSAFLSLCIDIVSELKAAHSPSEARSIFIRRTQVWQDLLRRAAQPKLSHQEQMGLVGEIGFLIDILISTIGAAPAVSAWTGPDGEAKDFEIGMSWVEVKAFAAQGKREVHISSETQLDDAGVADLFLYAVPVASSPNAATGGRTLHEIVASAAKTIRSLDLPAANAFEARVIQAGYSLDHDYEECWLTFAPSIYIVNLEFPSIRASMLPSGPHAVNYLLPLSCCDKWRVGENELIAAIKGMSK